MLKIEKNTIPAIDITAKPNDGLPSDAKNYNKVSIIGKAYKEKHKKKAEEEKEIRQFFHLMTACHQVTIKGSHIQIFVDLVNKQCDDIERMGLDKAQFLRNVKRELKIFRKYTNENNDMILQNLVWFRERLFDIYTNSNPYKSKAISFPKPFIKFHSLSSSEVVPQNKKLEFEEPDEETPNIISNIVTIYHGIVTYSPYLMALCCNTTDGRSNTVRCPSPITDMTRIGKDTVLAILPFRQKLLIISPSSCEMKSLDYSFHKISYLKQCKFVGLKMFGKTIYLVDWANNTVETITALEEQPTDIALGPQQHLLLAFANMNKVVCYSVGGRRLFQIQTQSTDVPTGISADRNYFYAVQGNVIYRISSEGGVSQRKIAIKARDICCDTNTIFLCDFLGITYTVRTSSDFWPSMTYHQQVHMQTVKSQIGIDDPCKIQNILSMSASSILLLYRGQEAKLFSDNGQVICRSTLTSKCRPSAVCRADSNEFLALYREDRKLQYIKCPELTEGHHINLDADYIQICHMVSNKYLALATSEDKAEIHILLITENKIDILDQISLRHGNVIIAATPINFVVADMTENTLGFYSSCGEKLFTKHLDFYTNPHHIYTDKLYFYVVFRRESVMICYNIIGERKWQLKLPSTPYSHIDVFQGTVYVVDIMHSRILLYKYHDWSSCCVQSKNPYIKNLDIRLKENKNEKILISKMCWLPNGQFVLSIFNNDCLLHVSKDGNITSTLALPSTATDICRWDCNQIGVTLPIQKELWIIGNLSKRIRTLPLSHPYIWVRKLGEGHIAGVCDKPSRLDVISIQNHNRGEIISAINMPFVKSLVIENETQNVLVVTKKKIFLYKPVTDRRRRSSSSSSSSSSNSSSSSSSSSSSKLVPTLLMPHIRPSPNFYGGYIDSMLVYLIDNTSMFALNDHNLEVSDHITNKQLDMHIDLVDVFSRNICVSEMMSSTLHLQDHTVSDKARHILSPRCVGDNEYIEVSGFSVITENNLILFYDNVNSNVKVLTFDGQLLDSMKLDISPEYMCRWQSNTLVMTTGKEYQLLTLKVEFPLSLVAYQTESEYNCIASLSDNLLACCANADGEKCLLLIKIDETQSTVCVMNKILDITKIIGNSSDKMDGITVTAEDVIILVGSDNLVFVKRDGELVRVVRHHMHIKLNYMTIDNSYLYVYGKWDKMTNLDLSHIVCLSQTGKYERIFLSKRHYKQDIKFSCINCYGPRFVGNLENRLYVEGLFKLNRERFFVCQLQTDRYPVEMKDLDISVDGQIVVCERINTGNVKIFQSYGELECYRDLGTLVGGVCYTKEKDIMVTVPYRREIFQLKQDLANYKVWQSEIPYGVIWRKAENTYWCAHINFTEYHTVEFDGDQLNVLERMSLLMRDSGLHFPPITPYMNDEIFSNESINALKYNKGDERGMSHKIIDKCRSKVRCGNYIVETTLGSNEVLVKRMPYRTAMFPLSIPTSMKLGYDHRDGCCSKLIMLADNVAVIIQNRTLIVSSTTGNVFHHTEIDKRAQDICRWTDNCFIVLLQEDKQLVFFKRDLSRLKTINIPKDYEMIYKKNDNQLVCGGYTLDKTSGWKFYYVEVVNIFDKTCEYSHEVWSGINELKKICVTSSEDIVIVEKEKWKYAVVCWYREGLTRSLEIKINLHDYRIHLSAHGQHIYITDLSNNIYQIASDGEQQLFLNTDDGELHTILGIDVSADFIMVFGPVLGFQSYCFLHYER